MSSREKILREIAKNKPAATPPPPRFQVEGGIPNPVEHYLTVLQSIGGKGKLITGMGEVQDLLTNRVRSGVEVVNGIPGLEPLNLDAYLDKEPVEVESVHTVFLKGGPAVAENASVWLTEGAMGNRMLPFVCQQLVLVFDEASLVANMHQAYERIRVDEDGYGVFVAGPSKTADIEQSLVIGAHGPLGLQVFIVKS